MMIQLLEELAGRKKRKTGIGAFLHDLISLRAHMKCSVQCLFAQGQLL